MKTQCTWTDKLRLVSLTNGHSVAMDAKRPLGEETAPTPKELLLAALCGCTAMDVVSLLKKHKQPLEELTIDADATVTTSHPAVFTAISLVYRLRGKLDPERVLEVVRLSETRFCSVSAMLSRTVPIHYTIELNGSQIGAGRASFDAIPSAPDQEIA